MLYLGREDPLLHSPDGADFLLRGIGNGDGGAVPELIPLGMGDEDGHSLRGEGELVHLDAHQFRAAEGPGEAKQDECPVPQGNDVIAEAVREKIQGLHENGRLPVLEGALFAPDGGHGGPVLCR